MPSQLQVDIQKIDSIKSDFFRDMTWLVYSGNINTTDIPSSYCFNLPEQLNIEATWEWYESIKDIVIKRPSSKLVLGKYNETLFLNYFLNHPKFHAVKHNIQLIDGKQTIGEIDYLLNTIDSEYIHLEIAIKYYLKTTVNNKTVYLGPSTNDWFKRKIEKLLQHQLQLTKKHRTLLASEFQDTDFFPQVMIKGSLFHPFVNDGIENYTPTLGWWLSIDHIDLLNEPNFTYNLILEKRQWIFPYNSRINRFDFKVLQHYLFQLLIEHNAIMVTRFNAKGLAVDRGFIVRAQWPN